MARNSSKKAEWQRESRMRLKAARTPLSVICSRCLISVAYITRPPKYCANCTQIVNKQYWQQRDQQANTVRRQETVKVQCATCATVFDIPRLKGWDKRRYCSTECASTAWLGAHKQAADKWRRAHPECHTPNECPACGAPCARHAVVCFVCFRFIAWRDGGRQYQSVQNNQRAIGTFTREDVAKWQTVTTQRKATLLLKQLSKTLQSQTSEKSQGPSVSLPKASQLRTQKTCAAL